MISVLAQERLLGAALGSILTGIVIFEQRRSIYESISATESMPREPIFGRRPSLEFAHLWNKSVDQRVGPIIKSLISNGWKRNFIEKTKGYERYPSYKNKHQARNTTKQKQSNYSFRAYPHKFKTTTDFLKAQISLH